MNSLTVITHGPEQTRSLGSRLGQLAAGNQLYLLTGNLGTGKTHLVQGIAFGLGVKEYACSPSFMIAREYHGRLALYHLDLYRLDHIEEIIDLGIEQYFTGDAVCAVEWAEKGEGVFPKDNLSIEMEHMNGDDREVTFIGRGSRYAQLVTQLKNNLLEDNEIRWNFQ
jgi:tRNA threonylcarbamoyladenosine biosynthesis protein TsaE